MATVEENFARWSQAGKSRRLQAAEAQVDYGRWLQLAAGGLLVLLGLRRGGLAGLGGMLLGGTLAYRAVTRQECLATTGPKELVDEASWESFPASDPPSWTASAGRR